MQSKTALVRLIVLSNWFGWHRVKVPNLFQIGNETYKLIDQPTITVLKDSIKKTKS